MPLVLIDDDLDRPRHLLADFEHVLDRRQLIELSAKDHHRTAKIGYPRSQVESTNEFVELGFILVAGHEHETIFASRRRFFEDLGETRFETGKADYHAAKPLGDRVREDSRRVRAEASSKNTDPVLIEVLSRVDPGDAGPAGIGEVVGRHLEAVHQRFGLPGPVDCQGRKAALEHLTYP